MKKKQSECVFLLFKVHITLGFQSEVSAVIIVKSRSHLMRSVAGSKRVMVASLTLTPSHLTTLIYRLMEIWKMSQAHLRAVFPGYR